MEQKAADRSPVLKTMLNNPLRNMPTVPSTDWSNSSTMGPPSSTHVVSRPTPQSSMNVMTPTNVQINDPHSTVTLQNCVATVGLGCELNLQTINFRTRNSEYNPMRFHGVIMRIREPRTTALIFRSGKIVVTGARNEENALLASKKYARIIQKLGFSVLCSAPFKPFSRCRWHQRQLQVAEITLGKRVSYLQFQPIREFKTMLYSSEWLKWNTVRFTDFKIQNIVATCDLRFPIKLENLNMVHGQFSSYEPELFPGLIYRMVKPRLVLLIFVNGKIVFTGAKSRQDLKDALDNIYPILKSFRKN